MAERRLALAELSDAVRMALTALPVEPVTAIVDLCTKAMGDVNSLVEGVSMPGDLEPYLSVTRMHEFETAFSLCHNPAVTPADLFKIAMMLDKARHRHNRARSTQAHKRTQTHTHTQTTHQFTHDRATRLHTGVHHRQTSSIACTHTY